MDWYVIDKKYINYLTQFDSHVGYVEYGERLKLHVGIREYPKVCVNLQTDVR